MTHNMVDQFKLDNIIKKASYTALEGEYGYHQLVQQLFGKDSSKKIGLKDLEDV